MDVPGGLLIILVLITIFFVCLVVRGQMYWNANKTRGFPRVLISDIYPLPEDDRDRQPLHLKSGDIILFIAHTDGFSNSLFTQDLFSHCGIVHKKHDGLYINEVSLSCSYQPDDICSDGKPHSWPLLTRLKHYPGSCFLVKLNKPLDLQRKQRLDYYAGSASSYPTAYQILLSLFGLRFYSSRHCMEHVAWIIDSIGLTPLKYQRKKTSLLGAGFLKCSRAVTGISRLALPDGYYYEEPAQILYNI